MTFLQRFWDKLTGFDNDAFEAMDSEVIIPTNAIYDELDAEDRDDA